MWWIALSTLRTTGAWAFALCHSLWRRPANARNVSSEILLTVSGPIILNFRAGFTRLTDAATKFLEKLTPSFVYLLISCSLQDTPQKASFSVQYLLVCIQNISHLPGCQWPVKTRPGKKAESEVALEVTEKWSYHVTCTKSRACRQQSKEA